MSAGSASAKPSAAPRRLVDEKVVVLDFGSQYAQLIARRVREQHVYCEIVRHDITAERLREIAPKGIILSGGPSSVYEKGAPKCDAELFQLGIPVLGICYGMQLACESLGGKVESAPAREYGRAQIRVTDAASELFADVPGEIEVWMSHGDQVSRVAGDFQPLAAHEHLPDRRRAARDAADLRLAIPSGSDAHAARQTDSAELPRRRSAAAAAPGRWATSPKKRSRGSASRSATSA